MAPKKQSHDDAPRSRPKVPVGLVKGTPKDPKVEKPKLARPNLVKRQVMKPNAVMSEAAEAEDLEPFKLLTEFSLFQKLPAELRVRIWRFSPCQRFIGLKFDSFSFKLPAILHVNMESRHEAKNHIWTLNLPEWGIVANPNLDILYLDQSSFSKKFTYHRNVFHTLTCSTKFDHNQIKAFTKIVVTLKEILDIWRRQCLHCFLTDKIINTLPNITEINIMLRQGGEGAEPSDMWVVDDHDKGGQIEFHRLFIDDVKRIWQRVCNENKQFEKITLNFVRFEQWTR